MAFLEVERSQSVLDKYSLLFDNFFSLLNFMSFSFYKEELICLIAFEKVELTLKAINTTMQAILRMQSDNLTLWMFW